MPGGKHGGSSSGSGSSSGGGSAEKYYAVAKGRSTGVYQSWEQCEAQVKGFSNSSFKKFDSMGQAQDFIVARAAEEVLREKLTQEVQQRK